MKESIKNMSENLSQIEYAPLPLDEDSFARVGENLKEGSMWANKELESFEDNLAQGNSFGSIENARVCLKDFCTMMGVIEGNIYHPSDIDRIFKDEKFKQEFSRVVKGIRKYNFIDTLHKLISEESAEDRPHVKLFLDNAENYLLKAEIYIAPYHK